MDPRRPCWNSAGTYVFLDPDASCRITHLKDSLVYDTTGAEDKMGQLADEVVFAGRASPFTPPVCLTSPRDLGPPITLRALW
jgi:hypothetical protein